MGFGFTAWCSGFEVSGISLAARPPFVILRLGKTPQVPGLSSWCCYPRDPSIQLIPTLGPKVYSISSIELFGSLGLGYTCKETRAWSLDLELHRAHALNSARGKVRRCMQIYQRSRTKTVETAFCSFISRSWV